ncbi:MAG: hypothetical protein PVG22_02655 [Chromatiales bacterium]
MLAGCLYGLTACVWRSPTPAVIPPPLPDTEPELLTGASAEMLVGNCFGCHGPQGRSLAPAIPSLAGLSETYFAEAMQAYQYGGRYATVMGRIALAYSDAEIRRMATYFKAQTPRLPAQETDLRLVDRGRRLHQRFCRDCHGDLQSLAEPDAVTLNGQWQPYLRWTLQDYLVGINRIRSGMSEALSGLIREQGAEGLEMLIHYYGSARP